MARNDIFNLANGALKWDKLKQAVKDNDNNDDFDIWDFLGDELGLDTNGQETNQHSLESNIGHLTVKALIEGGLKWGALKQAIKDSDFEDSDFDIWDFLGDEM